MLDDFAAEVREPKVRGSNLREAGFVLDLIRRAYDKIVPPTETSPP